MKFYTSRFRHYFVLCLSLLWGIFAIYITLNATEALELGITVKEILVCWLVFIVILSEGLKSTFICEVTPVSIWFDKKTALDWQDIEKAVVYKPLKMLINIYFIPRDKNKFPNKPVTGFLHYNDLWVTKEGKIFLPADCYELLSPKQIKQLAQEISKYVPVEWQ